MPGLSGERGRSWILDWASDRRNALRDMLSIESMGGAPLPPLVADLLDIGAAVYLADIASPRGALEEWVRTIELEIPVRDPGFWTNAAPDLIHLLYTLTHDNITVTFRAREEPDAPPASAGAAPADVDCVCLLSGGLDSFAGAVMLAHTGRRPLLVSHQSGNPTAEGAQRRVVAVLERLAPGKATWVGARVAPFHAGPAALPFPPPEQREPSRRARSFLFMVLGAAAAHAVGASEVYLCENGVLTAALPLTAARTGSLSTRSTHPAAIKLFSAITARAGLSCEMLNPFVHQTKGEVIRTFLKPLVPPADILDTVSCWGAGRQNRQCGGCVPCLLRRIGLLSAGLPDEAYMMDPLATPEQHRGTDAYGNLVDMLTQAATFLGRTDFDLLIEYPQLLDLEASGVSVEDTLRTLKRHAAEVFSVVGERFPAAAGLLKRAGQV